MSTSRAIREFVNKLDLWQQDRSTDRDSEYIDQLANVAIAGNMPIYLDGITNAGPPGWKRWAKELLTNSQEVKIQVDDKPRPLPWET